MGKCSYICKRIATCFKVRSYKMLLNHSPMRCFLLTALLVFAVATNQAANDYKNDKDYLALRDSMRHAFNDGDSARFFSAVKNLQAYLLGKNDLHGYYTQRCNEIVFLMNRQKIFEAYKLASQLSKELRERKLDNEMYMAYNMLGHINRYCGNKEAAKECFYKVIDLMEQAGYWESMPPIYMNIVNVEMGDNPEEAIRLLDKAREIAQKYAPERVFDIETRKTLSYYNRGDTEKFLEGYKAYREGVDSGLSSVHGRAVEVYYQATIGNVDKAVELARNELGDDGVEAITMVYEKAGRWKEAYESLRKQTTASDSVANVVLTNSMEGIRDEIRFYDVESRASRNRFIALGAVSVLLIVLVITLAYMVNTRRRHLRELRKAYDLALESDHLKTAFISNVSHEVRTPLNIISGFAQVLSDPEMDLGVAERQKLAKEMTKNARLITRLIDEMLGMSLGESSAEPDEHVPVKCNELLRDVVERQRDDVQGDTQLRFETSLADDFTVMTHEDMFRRIVTALVDNAVKYTNEGSVTVRASAADNQLTIAVEDTGIGIPPEEAEHIFERFVKLDDFKVGLGLGLSVCRLMASRLGGTVVLDTTYPGPGSRFVARLPIKN